MSRYKPYPAYKESGVQWLGKVPDHWDVKRLKYSISSCRNGIWGEDAAGDENDIPCVRVADFDRTSLRVTLKDPTIRNVTAKEKNNWLLSRGNLLLEKSGGGEKQPVGCVVLYADDRPAICSNFVARMEIAPGFDSSYICGIHAAAYSIRLSAGSINQTSGIQNLDQERYFNERAAFPLQLEQQSISKAIDRETTRIDTLITKKTRFIELLQEKRKALITHAVTKGLDPSVKLKHSGVEWIGEVPEHWEVKIIGYVLDAVGDVDHFMPVSVERGVPYLMTGDLKELVSCVNLEDCKQVSFSDYARLSKRIKSTMGDVIVARYATIGTSMYVDIDIDFLVSYSYVTIKTTPSKVSGLYLVHYLKSDAFFQGINNQVNTNTQGNVGINDLKKLKMALPSLSEQSRIIEYLNSKLKNIDSLTERTQRSINLLKERRSAFITAAVTGQIDLRESA